MSRTYKAIVSLRSKNHEIIPIPPWEWARYVLLDRCLPIHSIQSLFFHGIQEVGRYIYAWWQITWQVKHEIERAFYCPKLSWEYCIQAWKSNYNSNVFVIFNLYDLSHFKIRRAKKIWGTRRKSSPFLRKKTVFCRVPHIFWPFLFWYGFNIFQVIYYVQKN